MAARGRRRTVSLRGISYALILTWPLELVTPGIGDPLQSSFAVREAWQTVQTYHHDLTQIDRARDQLKTEVAGTPTVEALLLLSWLHFAWGDYRATTREAKLASYERGQDLAKLAIELAPRSPDAHLWYAANLGRWAITKGKLRAAFVLSTLRNEIHTILELDPDHVPGLSLAGSFYLETPGLLGGDVSRAERYLRHALAVDPRFTRARVELARCLIEHGRYDEARGELQRVIEESRPTYRADWVVEHRPMSERLLATIREK